MRGQQGARAEPELGDGLWTRPWRVAKGTSSTGLRPAFVSARARGASAVVMTPCVSGCRSAQWWRRCRNRDCSGLEVYARLDKDTYPDKIKVTNTQFKTINIAGHEFHPEWNYIIRPHDH